MRSRRRACVSLSTIIANPNPNLDPDHLFSCLDKLSDLTGVGVRVKKIGPIKAKVYSTGLYAPKGSVINKCKSIKCNSASELAKSKAFEQAFTAAGFEKTIKLKMARTVGAEKMVEAISESVAPRLGGKDPKALATFKSILVDGLKDGGATNNMVFSFHCGKKLSIGIDGKHKGDVGSTALANAFVGVYMDSKSVSPALKDDVAKTVYGWCN